VGAFGGVVGEWEGFVMDLDSRKTIWGLAFGEGMWKDEGVEIDENMNTSLIPH
jgi:hypothetical protein